MTGVLAGLSVVELAGIGPAPFAGMLLADHGADVLRIDRPGTPALGPTGRHDLLGRGKRSAILDVKHPRGAETVRALAARADVLIEGYRPGVAERLGIGPADLHAVNPALVYGRVTGWGQDGPLASAAGHDITYLALSGVLHALDATPPINLLGDYGAGGMLLFGGVLAALWRAARTGTGAVVDAAVLDGTALLSTQVHGLLHAGLWQDRPRANLLDGAAPFYRTYPTADGGHLAVGPLEPRFYAEFLAILGLDDPPDRDDPATWPALTTRIAARIATRTRDEWAAAFAGSDACVAPVLSLTEAPTHHHNAARAVFTTAHGITQPSPAPRFDGATPTAPSLPPPEPGEHTREALTAWSIPDVDALITAGIALQP